MTHCYRVLEDVALADAAFEASGDSPSELFRAAAQAVIETLANPSTVGQSWKRTVVREAPDVSDLLFHWLSEIVYIKDAEGVVFNGVIAQVEQRLDTVWYLRGTLTGESIDAVRQELRSDIKAVTKHLYEVRQEGGKWFARVVIDV